MTVCSSAVAFIGMPFNLWAYSTLLKIQESSSVVIPYGIIIKTLIFLTIPAVVGMLIKHFIPKVAAVITKVKHSLHAVTCLISVCVALLL